MSLNGQEYQFQSEVQQLLNILIFSLYKNRDVFLRELISNASDALNRVHYLILSGQDVWQPELPLKIEIQTDSKQNRLIVTDTGIGMTGEELVSNIGTIARSGTLEFLQQLKEQQESQDLIGKFGVGFYSCFMVAKEIHLYTRSYRSNATACLWKSKGEKTYQIENADYKERGTRIELLLKKDASEYLNRENLKTIILKYSQFISFPIYLDGELLERKDAIWLQSRANLKEEDYQSFYSYFSGFSSEALSYLHIAVDAPVQFRALLYFPKENLPVFLQERKPQLELYNHKVLIEKHCDYLLPEYLFFLKGIVDSEEIALNVSRETIQNNVKVEKIKKFLTRKVIEHLLSLKEQQKEKFRELWKSFDRFFKQGALTDFENRERIAQLLLFSASQDPENLIGLKDYVLLMKPEQKEIYYLTAPSVKEAGLRPAMEYYTSHQLNVLILTDPLEEVLLETLAEFNKFKFRNIEKEDKSDEKKRAEVLKPEEEDFLKYLKELFKGQLADVRFSERLKDSPAILLQSAQAMSVELEKMLQIIDQNYQKSLRILELNPIHPLVQKMVELFSRDRHSNILEVISRQLLDNLLLMEKNVLDPQETCRRIQLLMGSALESELSRFQG